MGSFHYTFLLIFLRCQLLRAGTKDETWDVLSQSEVSNTYQNNVTDCAEILHDFADSASELTKCSIIFARPIRLCEKCIDQYVNFNARYKALLNGTDIDGTSCKSKFISNDRLDAIVHYHDNILNIWNEGHCNECFIWSKDVPVITNETVNFNILHNKTISCIQKTSSLYPNHSEEVCDKCKQSYLQLDSFYKTMSADAIGVDSICMDIFDAMNNTRSIWSKTLNCCKIRKTPEVIFLCSTAIISLLPLFYYLVLRYCGPIRDLANELKQSRFKQMILRSNNRTIN